MLTLSIGSLTTRIDHLRSPNLPRVVVNPLTAEYTVLGSTVLRGSAVQSKHLWSVSAYLSEADYLILAAIAEESDFLRRSLQNPHITLIDTWQRLFERSPRTRAIAPGTSEILLPPQVGYFAQFNAVFTKPPEIINSSGSRFEVDFDLAEGDILFS